MFGSLYRLIIVLAVTLIANLYGYQFMPVSEYGDGFAMQLAAGVALVTDGAESGLIDESWLPLLHAVRFASVAPFIAAEEAIGPTGSVVLLLLLLLPLTRSPGSSGGNLFTALPLLLPLFVSGRSVLVAVAVGYIAMNIMERRRQWMLWFGSLLANLSSASVLIAIILLFFDNVKISRARIEFNQKTQRFFVLALLLISFILSAVDKISGFGSGDAGYAAHAVDSDNFFIQIISRSTLAVSIVEGQYLRAVAYGAIAILLLVKLIAAFLDPRQKTERYLVICCFPAIFLEGLGVMAMVFPIIWLLSGLDAGRQRSDLVRSQST